MALQHFYSRVPFRISIFNKADSYDTFAMSDGLDRNFIEKELFAVCERKPSAAEQEKIREGKLPPVYYSYMTKSGQFIQSCQSYIPRDYTGERSSYLVHSLVFNEDEKNYVLANPYNAILNKELFETDIEQYDITTLTEPDKHCEERQIVAVEADSTAEFVKKYDETMMKNFIFSLLDVVCGKTKCLYFSVPNENDVDEVLYFFNTVMQVIPYHIRQGVAFASGVSDVSVLPHFNVKAVRDAEEDIQGSKGVYIRFGTNVVTGLKEDKYKASIRIVDFFYDLMSRDNVRREFLEYAETAVKKVPELGGYNQKALYDLVYMFCCGSNYYEEAAVLPNDDAVINFFTIYSKARDAMCEDYRMNSLNCLKRYPKNHLEIPRKVFSVLAKIYPSECPGGKRIIATVILELIHTDIMRTKLFTFIKNNFNKENAEAKDIITENLSRVFYGGFLQSQILAMFEERFPDLSSLSKSYLIDKFLLSLRTKSIQDEIIRFFEVNYPYLTYDNKREIYSNIAEHFTEGDELAVKLLDFAHAHIEEEPDENKTEFAKDVFDVIEAEQRKHSHPLLTIICEKSGFTARILEHKILSSWLYRNVFEEFVNLSCKNCFSKFIRNTIDLFYEMDDVKEPALAKLREFIENALNREDASYDIKELTLAYSAIADMKKSKMQQISCQFLEDLASQVIGIHMSDSLCKVFKNLKSENAVETLMELVDKSQETKESDQYKILTDYIAMKEAAKNCNKMLFVEKIRSMVQNEAIRGENGDKDLPKSIGAYMLKDFERMSGELQEPLKSLFVICGLILQNKKVEFSAYYDKLGEELMELATAEPEIEEEPEEEPEKPETVVEKPAEKPAEKPEEKSKDTSKGKSKEKSKDKEKKKKEKPKKEPKKKPKKTVKKKAKKKSKKQIQKETDVLCADFLLSLGFSLFHSQIPAFIDALKNGNSDYADMLLKITSNGKKKGVKFIKTEISKKTLGSPAFFTFCEKEIEKSKPKKKGLFAKLFKKSK